MVLEYLRNLPAELDELSFPASGQRLSENVRARLIERGEEFLGFSWPVLTAADYLRFTHDGDRSAFEEKYYTRRRVLCALALAEWCEGKGRFAGDLVNGVWAVCEESAWQLPAHNNYVRDTPPLPLPDTARPIPDLFACETGALLSLLPHLTKDALDGISPLLRERIRVEVEKRILTPYLTSHFWWMGDKPTCNWTPWCTQNVLLCAFSTGQSQDVKRRVIKQAAHSLDCYLGEIGEDGCCEEGAFYYRHSALTLWGALSILNEVCADAFADLFAEKKIRNMAHYLVDVHVNDDWYLNFADCSAKPGRCSAREFLFGKAVDDGALRAMAARDCAALEDWDLPNEINLWYRLLTALHRDEIFAYREEPCRPSSGVFYPSTGLWAVRRGRWLAALRAGHNGGSHGHNDAGSFALYRDGEPFIIDLGVESYTAKTFSKDRYSIWTMRSDWHNLPVIDGVVQQNGAAFGASDVTWSLDGPEPFVSLELSSAYPLPKPCSYRRTLRLGTAGPVLEDRITGGEAVLTLLFHKKPVFEDSVLRVGNCAVELEGCGAVKLEAVPIRDAMLRRAWPETVYRALLPVRERLTLRFPS